MYFFLPIYLLNYLIIRLSIIRSIIIRFGTFNVLHLILPHPSVCKEDSDGKRLYHTKGSEKHFKTTVILVFGDRIDDP